MIGGIENETNEFEQILLKIDSSYWHNEFQIKFQAYGNPSGAFDTWLVDYIFLNQSRYQDDVAYLDRVLTRRPSFLTTPLYSHANRAILLKSQ